MLTKSGGEFGSQGKLAWAVVKHGGDPNTGSSLRVDCNISERVTTELAYHRLTALQGNFCSSHPCSMHMLAKEPMHRTKSLTRMDFPM